MLCRKIIVFFKCVGIILVLKQILDNMKQPAAILVLQYWYTILEILEHQKQLKQKYILSLVIFKKDFNGEC
jgi:hypothetical protein